MMSRGLSNHIVTPSVAGTDARFQHLGCELTSGGGQANSQVCAELVNALVQWGANAQLSREDAEDLAQSTFERLLRTARQGTRIQDARSFARQTWKRLLIDWVRKRRGRSKLGPRASEETLPDDPVDSAASDPAELAAADERMSRVRDLLSGISDKQRVAIQLIVLEELTYREAAARLEVPVGTLKSRVHESLARLRRDERWRALAVG